MKKLEAGSRRAGSLLVAVSILAVVFASGLWGQTSYSSPVRVTNTPLPVAAPNPLPVSSPKPLSVTGPGGAEVVVTGKVAVTNSVFNVAAPNPLPVSSPKPLTVSGSVAVTPTSGQPLIVSPNGGQMAVVPGGGQWPVTPAGGVMPISGTVALSGTPQVALSTTGNTVNLAGTPFVDGPTVFMQGGTESSQFSLFQNTSGAVREIETMSLLCGAPVGQKITIAFLHVSQNPLSARFVIPMTFAGTATDAVPANDVWVGLLPSRVYIPPSATALLWLTRSDSTGVLTCFVGMAGRQY